MINDKELRSAAKELVSVLGLVDENKEDIVITKTTTPSALKKIINDVINAKLIAPTDELSDETQEVVIAMTPKKGKKAKDEDEEETPKQTAERLHKENIANAKINTVKGMDDLDEEEDDKEEEEEEVKKPAPAKKGKKAEKKKVTVTRSACICKVMNSVPAKGKTIDELALLADTAYTKAGGTSNVKQTVHHIKVLIPAAVEWGIITVDGNKILPA
jgi:hypothetical protein